MKFSLIFYLIVLSVGISKASNPFVKTNNGLVQGSWRESTKGRTYASFRGIPYAQPPVWKNRFKEPQEMRSWSGSWDATRKMSECLQYNPFYKNVTDSEDCLHLNIHTPQLSEYASLPVLVFIHGGVFFYGAGGHYGPENFMDWNIIVVTINYRLGPLGFLSTGDNVIPGNYGLKDQAFALHWIKKNIKAFGGNPESITLTGYGAGGASVHYHYLSPLSEGTFARGIAFGGVAITPWALCLNPGAVSKKLGTFIRCPTDNTEAMLQCLRLKPATEIVKTQLKLFGRRNNYYPVFSPSIELPGAERPFITEHPYVSSKAGKMLKLPLITTVAADGGLYPAAAYLTSPSILRNIERNWEKDAAEIFIYNMTLHSRVAQTIKDHYFGGKAISRKTFPDLVEAIGDRLFNMDAGNVAQCHANHSGQPSYIYKYSFKSPISVTRFFTLDDKYYGVGHGDDIIRIFKFLDIEFPDQEDKDMISGIIQTIYSYATTGIPVIPQKGATWLPVKPGAPELDYLDIISPMNCVMKSDKDFGQNAFWDNLGFNEDDNYKPS